MDDLENDRFPPVSTSQSQIVRPQDVSDALWDVCRDDYKSGVTLRQISENRRIEYNILYARKGKERWSKNLKEEAKAEVFVRLAMDDTPGFARDDEAVVASAADKAAPVVRRQRAVTSIGMDTVQMGLSEAKEALAKAMNSRATVAERRKDLAAIASRVLYYSNAMDRLIRSERKAYSLDDGEREVSYEDQLKAWANQRRAQAATPALASNVGDPRFTH